MDAVPLLLALLREARPRVQAWGLAALLRILRGSTANLSACDRCAAAAWLCNDLNTDLHAACAGIALGVLLPAAHQRHQACMPASVKLVYLSAWSPSFFFPHFGFRTDGFDPSKCCLRLHLHTSQEFSNA